MGKTFVRGDRMADLFDIVIAKKLSGGGGGGSSDFSTATVTLVCDASLLQYVTIIGGVCVESYPSAGITEPTMICSINPSLIGLEYKATLYKGSTMWVAHVPSEMISVSGDITASAMGGDETMLLITGDGTITISAE